MSMSTRRAILRELHQRHQATGNGYTRPAEIAGFGKEPARYQQAVNALLQERLINGTKDQEGRLAIAINDQRRDDVRRELRPWFARPAAWLGAVVLIAAVVAAMLL
jgi:hypothetical protein